VRLSAGATCGGLDVAIAGAIRKARATRDRARLNTTFFIIVSFLRRELVYDSKQVVPEKRVPAGG
jgi:hypothetical protein